MIDLIALKTVATLDLPPQAGGVERAAGRQPLSARRSDGSGGHPLLFAQELEHLACHEIRVHDGQVVSTTPGMISVFTCGATRFSRRTAAAAE